MKKFNIPQKPKQEFSGGKREVISLRLPKDLLKRLEKEMKDKGYSQTELIELILDQYFQYEDNR